MTWEEVCRIALGLPGVEMGSYHGYPALRVAGKFLVRLSDDSTSIEIKGLAFDEREAMLLAAPDLYYVPSGFGGKGVFARLSSLDTAKTRELLDRRWRANAPKRLLTTTRQETRRV